MFSASRRVPLALIAAVFAGCTLQVEENELGTQQSEIIYGADNRVEYLNATAEQQGWSRSVGMLVNRNGITCTGSPATCTIPLIPPMATDPSSGYDAMGLCPGEAFGPSLLQPLGQLTPTDGYCTAFLVGSDRMVTAGHCLIEKGGTLAQAQATCNSGSVMFDFTADAYGNAPSGLPRDRFFNCKTVLTARYDGVGKLDYAVFTVEPAVTGRAPLPIRRVRRKVAVNEDLVLAGYPLGLPLKVAAGARVVGNTPADWFWTNADAFVGSSGSPVINRDTGVVEGVESGNLADPDVDFETNPLTGLKCIRSHNCSDTGCSGRTDLVTRTQFVASHIPSLSPRTFAGGGTATRGGDYQPISGDFNGDGNFDIYWYAPGAAADEIWSFAGKKAYQVVSASSVGTYKTTSGDFDGDGRYDILWYAPGAPQDWVSYGRADGGFDDVAVTAPEASIVFAGDFNGNGSADIYFYTPGATADYIWSFTGRTKTSISKNVNGTYVPLAGDFNGDGRSDIYWYGVGANGDATWWGTSSAGAFNGAPHTSQPGTFQPFAGDFDGDGRDDVFWYAPGAAADPIWYGASTGYFSNNATTVNGTFLPISGDFDGNTAADIHWYGKNAASDSFSWGRVK
jgi:V8-like Glu-specific endopeptidase